MPPTGGSQRTPTGDRLCGMWRSHQGIVTQRLRLDCHRERPMNGYLKSSKRPQIANIVEPCAPENRPSKSKTDNYVNFSFAPRGEVHRPRKRPTGRNVRAVSWNCDQVTKPKMRAVPSHGDEVTEAKRAAKRNDDCSHTAAPSRCSGIDRTAVPPARSPSK
jgi:hypothetical protein